ncbi:MAG: hypothetical protein CTY16_06105 [Methylobacter sp.]|nr:MAG: hypothetical protein CTY16_06105 [Methylobacter sp.]
MAVFIRITIIAALLGMLSACAAYPSPYGAYPGSAPTYRRVVVGNGYYRAPPPVIIKRKVYGYPRYYQRPHGGYGHGHHHHDHDD